MMNLIKLTDTEGDAVLIDVKQISYVWDNQDYRSVFLLDGNQHSEIEVAQTIDEIENLLQGRRD